MEPDDILTIRTERTPNPHSLKYVVGRRLVARGSANFPFPAAAEGKSPLARRIFSVPGVSGVFLGGDFFTVTRIPGTPWEDINEKLAPALEAFFDSGEPVLEGTPQELPKELNDPNAPPELIEKIKQLIDDNVRPAVAGDGGDIVFRGFAGGVVYLEMRGACADCPSSGATLKSGVETMLREHIPEILAVEAVES